MSRAITNSFDRTFGRAKVAVAALCTLMIISVAFVNTQVAMAAGPQSVADLAERLSPAVVNISTKQSVKKRKSVPIPNLPEDSPFRDFFDDFFDRNKPKGKGGPKPMAPNLKPR